MRVSEIRVKRIRVNQGLGVFCKLTNIFFFIFNQTILQNIRHCAQLQRRKIVLTHAIIIIV